MGVVIELLDTVSLMGVAIVLLLQWGFIGYCFFNGCGQINIELRPLFSER